MGKSLGEVEMSPQSQDLYEHRLKIVEEAVDEIIKEANVAREKTGGVSLDIKLIQKDIQNTTDAIIEIKKSINKLEENRTQDHYVQPLMIRKNREEKIVLLFKTIAYGGLIAYILARLFPMINW